MGNHYYLKNKQGQLSAEVIHQRTPNPHLLVNVASNGVGGQVSSITIPKMKLLEMGFAKVDFQVCRDITLRRVKINTSNISCCSLVIFSLSKCHDGEVSVERNAGSVDLSGSIVQFHFDTANMVGQKTFVVGYDDLFA